MTKKSHARQVRDSKLKDAKQEANVQIKDNRIYDDINEVYISCAHTLVGYASSVNAICLPEIIPHMNVEQQQKIKVLVTAIKDDIDSFTNDLITINSPFKDKKGGEPKLENFIETIGVIDQFQEFIGRCKGTLDPVFNSLASEIAVVAEQANGQATTLEEAQDVNVITDVVIKESTKTNE